MTERTEGQPDTSRARALRTRGQRIKRCDRRALKKAFIACFCSSRNVTLACQQIGIVRGTFYRWLKQDTDFAGEYQRLCDMFWKPRDLEPVPEATEDIWMHASERELMRAFNRMERMTRRSGLAW